MVLITCVWKQSFPWSMYSKSLEREREREERKRQGGGWKLKPLSSCGCAHLWDTYCCFPTVQYPGLICETHTVASLQYIPRMCWLIWHFKNPELLSLSLSLFLSLPLPPNHLIWIFLIVDLNIVCVLSINQKLTTNKQRQMVSYALKKLVHSQVEKPLWTCIQPKTYLPLFFISARRFYT